MNSSKVATQRETVAAGVLVVVAAVSMLALALVASSTPTSAPEFWLPPGLLAGFLLGAGFSASVGPQNLYLIRAGLVRRHLLHVTVAGLGSELILLATSVLASGAIVVALGSMRSAAIALGAAYLMWCGLRMLTQHNRHGLDHLTLKPETHSHAVATMLAVTWCNPLGYLKWAIFAGVLLAQPGEYERGWCIAGLALSSLLKFALWPLAGRLLGHILRHTSATLWFNRVSGTALIASGLFTFGQV